MRKHTKHGNIPPGKPKSWRPGWRSDSRIAAQTPAVGEPVQNRGPVVYGDPRPIKPRSHVGFYDTDYFRPQSRDSLDRSGENKLRGFLRPTTGKIRKAYPEDEGRY